MPRACRNFCGGRVWHVTHRCHKKAFLLKFARDRRRWRHWLFVAQRRYGLSVLNYVVTSNHVHLLLADQGHDEISRSMQLVAARTAQEYNVRKKRRGAFWEDRYHATAIQTDKHLLRCLTYIDLNMVRAAAVNHPKAWEVCGYNEIQCPWRRKGVIDFEMLGAYLEMSSRDEIAALLHRRIDEEIVSSRRDPVWTESIGVGDRKYLSRLKNDLGVRGYGKYMAECNETLVLRDCGNP
jgi:putative transposase